MDEIDIASGSRLQSMYVNANPAEGGCTLSTVFPTEGIAARTYDTFSVLIPCWARGPNPTGANTAGYSKVVMRVDPSGSISNVASFIDGAQYFRSVQASSAQNAGDMLYAFTSSNVHNVSVGNVNATGPFVTTAGAYRGSALISPGTVYAVTTGAGVVVISDSTNSALGTATQYLPGITSTTNAGWVAVKDENTLFLTDWQGSGSITKWALSPSSGNWEIAATVNSMSLTWQGITYTTATARGTVGFVDPQSSNYVLLFTTATIGAYANGANFLVKYGELNLLVSRWC